LPSGASVRITDQLLSTTTNISNLLSLSPIFSAILALQAESMRSRYPSRSIPEIATYILHDWTTKLLDFLHELLRLSIGTNAESGAPFDALRDWVSELLVTKSSLGRGKGEGTLVDQILSQLGEIHSKLDILVRSPRTSGPDFELLTFRVGAVRAEQGKLVGMLGVIAQGGFLGRGHVIKVLKWLKKSDRVDATVGSVLALVERPLLGASAEAACRCFLAIARPIDMLRTSDTQFEVKQPYLLSFPSLMVSQGGRRMVSRYEFFKAGIEISSTLRSPTRGNASADHSSLLKIGPSRAFEKQRSSLGASSSYLPFDTIPRSHNSRSM